MYIRKLSNGLTRVHLPSKDDISTKKCPECKGALFPDSEYPDDLLCGHCGKVFDSETLGFVGEF